MAENFQGQAGVSGGTWWNSPKEAFVSPCSLGIGVGTTPFGWQSMPETTPERKKAAKLQQREADSDSGSSSVTIDSTLQILGLRFSPSGNSPSAWNPPILQEDMNSSLVGTSQTGQGFIQTGFPINAQSIPSSYNFSSSSSPNLSTNLYDPTQSNNNNLPFLMNHNNYLSCPNDLPSPEILLNPSEIPNIPKQQASGFDFPNNYAPFWSNSSTSALNNNGTSTTTGFVASSSQPALSTQFLPGQFQEKPMSCFKTSATSDVRHPKFVAMKIRTDEPATKKTRLATPSPLPSFKVRKANLRDQITALQQLVSPFGKTDTASVLQEAIEYIKFLHDQVNVLSTPYMKQGSSVQQQQNSNKPKDQEGNDIEQDLRSRGLCLVPISSTFPVANETNADFWTPSFG